MKQLFSGQLKPLLRIGLAFGLVWLFNGLTKSVLTGWVRFGTILALSIGMWVLIMRILFSVEASS